MRRPDYCTKDSGSCSTCSLANYGRDCQNSPIEAKCVKGNKWDRAMKHYNGHKGSATIAHVERNIKSAYPEAYDELTGVQYGKLMSVANTSYQDGKASGKIDMWSYDGEADWIAGIRGTDTVIEVTPTEITIISNARTDKEVKRTYKLQ